MTTDRWGEGDPWLSADGNTLVFTRWDHAVGWAETVDLFIAFRDGESWSDPVPIEHLNTDGADFGAAASADGEWFYYWADSRFMRVPMSWLMETYGR